MPSAVIPSSQKVIRVGWVGTGPFSFYGHYIRVINNIFRDYNFMNMRVTHIWGDDYARNYRGSPEYVRKMVDFWKSDEQSPEGIAKMCGIPNVCSDFHDMADEVDAAMIMDFDRSYELAEPFLDKGMPIFLCSPVAVNVPECRRILDRAAATGSAVYSGSFTVDMHENQSRYLRIRRDEIASFFASTTHNFFTSYANDGLEPVYRLIGGGARTVSLHGWNGSRGYDPTGIPVSRIHIEYEPRGDKPPIQGVLTLGGFKNEYEWYRVCYHDHTVFEGMTNRPDSRELMFRDFLINLQEVFTTNKSIETHDDILQKLKVVIAAYKSANEGNRPVNVDEIGDYRLPTVRIEYWDKIPE
ncbi:Gfo/Idh/MocA family oxidoreductase [bacterium]|nr:Gfo/Idh/MocA family oxidoreductase [bacterium]